MSLTSQKLKVLALLVGVVVAPAISVADPVEEMAKRIDRLERIVQSQGLTSLISQVDQLQREVQRLNGDNEALKHQLEQLQKSQREQYIDLDERIEILASQPLAANSKPSQLSAESADNASQAADAELTEVEQEENAENGRTGPVSVENGEAAYQAALQTLRSGQYEQAIVQLTSFPQQYPQSSFLPNVYYWQGEANYVVRQFEQAVQAFKKVLDDYPQSSKVPDALLKRGFSEFEMGEVDKAKTTLNQVMELYSDSSAARLAKVRLDRIQKDTQ